jgi:hypothetical protein
MRSQPGTKQRSKAFQGVDMHFMKTVSIFITGVLSGRVIDALAQAAPFRQAIIEVLFIRIELTA